MVFMSGDRNTRLFIGFLIVMVLQVGKEERRKYILSAYNVPSIV